MGDNSDILVRIEFLNFRNRTDIREVYNIYRRLNIHPDVHTETRVINSIDRLYKYGSTIYLQKSIVAAIGESILDELATYDENKEENKERIETLKVCFKALKENEI